MNKYTELALVDIFLISHENQWLNECPPEFKPKYYKRYIDKTFLSFKENTHIQQFCITQQ